MIVGTTIRGESPKGAKRDLDIYTLDNGKVSIAIRQPNKSDADWEVIVERDELLQVVQSLLGTAATKPPPTR